MKKLFFALMAFMAVYTVNAQDRAILVYADAAYGMNKTSIGNVDSNSMQWHILPGVGYQLNNHWTIGVQGGYGGTSMKHYGGSEVDNLNEWSAGLFARFTQNISDRCFFYGQLSASYLNGANTASINGNDVTLFTYNGFGAQLLPVFGVRLTKCLALNFGVGGLAYRSTTTDESPAVKNQQFQVTLGQQFNFGVSAYLGVHHHTRMDPGADMHHIDASDDDDDEAPAPRKHHHKKAKADDVDD